MRYISPEGNKTTFCSGWSTLLNNLIFGLFAVEANFVNADFAPSADSPINGLLIIICTFALWQVVPIWRALDEFLAKL